MSPATSEMKSERIIYIGPDSLARQALAGHDAVHGIDRAQDVHALRHEISRGSGTVRTRVVIAGCSDDLGGIAPVNLAGALARYENVEVDLLSSSDDSLFAESLKGHSNVTLLDPDPGFQQDPGERFSGSVAFFSVDGGVGKSTLAATTGWCAAGRSVETMIVDLDVHFGRLGSILNAGSRSDLVDVMRGLPLDGTRAVSLSSQLSRGLRYLAGSMDPVRGDELCLMADPAVSFMNGLSGLKIFDLSTYWNDLTCAALSQVDRAYLVTKGESDAPARISSAFELCTALGVPRTKISVVVNHHDPKWDGSSAEEGLLSLVGAHQIHRVIRSDHIFDLHGSQGFTTLPDRAPRFVRDVRELTTTMLAELGVVAMPEPFSEGRGGPRWSPFRMKRGS